MIETVLGVVGAAGFIIAAFPMAWRVFRTPKLVGFSAVGYTALTVAIFALQIQLFLSHAWPMFFAQSFNTVQVSFILVEIYRKS